mmetsp:Transcript_31518/g.102686  ORF Transcript_31518/g.102686 Transcript_31518/m.102686 type:complete len:1118 (+) Transcript_31518:129-3482(+)
MAPMASSLSRPGRALHPVRRARRGRAVRAEARASLLDELEALTGPIGVLRSSAPEADEGVAGGAAAAVDAAVDAARSEAARLYDVSVSAASAFAPAGLEGRVPPELAQAGMAVRERAGAAVAELAAAAAPALENLRPYVATAQQTELQLSTQMREVISSLTPSTDGVSTALAKGAAFAELASAAASDPASIESRVREVLEGAVTGPAREWVGGAVAELAAASAPAIEAANPIIADAQRLELSLSNQMREALAQLVPAPFAETLAGAAATALSVLPSAEVLASGVTGGSVFLLVVALLAYVAGDPGSGMNEWAALAAKEGDEEPDELKVYDPEVSRAFFAKKPLTLLKRSLRSSILLGAFTTALVMDARLGRRPEDDEDARARIDSVRAEQLRVLLVRLGPTYVKLGQVLSSRQDLLPAPYIERLRTLQDDVPPFGDDAARRIISSQLTPARAGRLRLSPKPLASASLGQVYKAEQLDESGSVVREVAVKVQRPGALVAISLDIAIIRFFGPILYKYNEPNGNLDIVAICDEWGRRFIDELDYGLEAENGAKFQAAMELRKDLGAVVMTATVEEEYCARRVLTTQWIDGCRLDESSEGDVGTLCAWALNAYLCMLLDTRKLHVDPHPGNLFRTNDGKLCILDWGLVTDVTEEQSGAILNFIAHLVSKDFSKVDADLVAMGFVLPEKRAALNEAGLSNAIATLFSALAAGGGAAGFRSELGLPDEDELKELRKELVKIKDKEKRKEAFIEAAGGSQSKVAQLTKDLEEVQQKYGNIFVIPSYFGYILRAFSVLEGIGLAQNPEYSIANECYPYVARRLLTDPSPNTRAALEQLLYGADGPTATLSVERVQQLGSAFSDYSATMRSSSSMDASSSSTSRAASPDAASDAPAAAPVVVAGVGAGAAAASDDGLSPGTREALRLFLSPEGGPLQDIVLREIARYSSAAAMDAAEKTLHAAFAEGSLLRLQHQAVEALGPARAVLAPLPTPYEVFDQFLKPNVTKTQADVETLEVAEALRGLIAEAARPSDPTLAAAESAGEEAPDSLEAAVLPILRALPSERLSRELFELAPELLPGAQAAALRLSALLLEQSASRVGARTAEAAPDKTEESLALVAETRAR